MADHYRQQSDYGYNGQQSDYRGQYSSYTDQQSDYSYTDQQSDYSYTDQQSDNSGQQYNYNTQQSAYSRQSSNYNGQELNNGGQKSNNRAFIIGIIAILVIGAVGIIIAVSVFGFDDNSNNSSNSTYLSTPSHEVTTVLTDMYDQYCSRTGTWCSVGDDGSYLRIDTNPNDRDNYVNENAFAAIENINSALGLPDSLLIEMESTAAIDGRQSATFESIGITVSWSYAPSKGLEVTYRLNYE